MFSQDDTEEISNTLDEFEEDIEVIEEEESGISEFFTNSNRNTARQTVKRTTSQNQKRPRVGKEEIADIIKVRVERNNPDETFSRRTYRYIIDEVYYAIAQELLRGNEVSLYPIGVLAPGNFMNSLRGRIDNWFFTFVNLRPSNDFRKKLKLYELSRASKEERELFKEALKKLPETDFNLNN